MCENMKLIFIITLQDKELEGKTASVCLAITIRVHCEKHGMSPASLSPPPPRAPSTLHYSLISGVFMRLVIPALESSDSQRGLRPPCLPHPALNDRGTGLQRAVISTPGSLCLTPLPYRWVQELFCSPLFCGITLVQYSTLILTARLADFEIDTCPCNHQLN